MDALTLFTKFLPLALPKLEIVRQVLEAHGIVAKTNWRPDMNYYDSDDDSIELIWSWKRSTYTLAAVFSFDTDGAGDVTLTLDPSGYFEGISVYASRRENDEAGWMVGGGNKLPKECELLWESLPGYDYEDGFSSEETAREAMGMIATFFANLPEDPPPQS